MRRFSIDNDVKIQAYSGTNTVLLAFDTNFSEQRRAQFLGFAISRKILSGRRKGEIAWLQGILDFENSSKKPGELIASNVAPIQKYRWGDYTVYPNTEYEYTVQPVFKRSSTDRVTASNRRLFLEDGPSIRLRTQSGDGDNDIIFNRAVAASQAFSRRFRDIDDQIEAAKQAGTLGEFSLPSSALRWLSRGLDDKILDFIEKAEDDRYELHIAIYEYHLKLMHDTLIGAANRGVKIRLLIHNSAKSGGDKATKENHEVLEAADIPNAEVIERDTTKLMHNKFIVRRKVNDSGQLQPEAVLTGSTNWSENGFYRQANVVHISRNPSILEQYTDYFDALVSSRDDRGATKRWVNKNNPLPNHPQRFVGFSPRSRFEDIEWITRQISEARRDVFFSTAFKIRDEIKGALLGAENDNILRLGIQNSESKITGTHRDRTASFTASAMLNFGLEGWLKESLAKQSGSLRIHTKIVLLDATSDNPLLLSGSHNLSKNASEGNDENYLVLRGDTDVADIYLCELMRIYEHYRFRFVARTRRRADLPIQPPRLVGDGSWSDKYHVPGSLEALDRVNHSRSDIDGFN